MTSLEKRETKSDWCSVEEQRLGQSDAASNDSIGRVVQSNRFKSSDEAASNFTELYRVSSQIFLWRLWYPREINLKKTNKTKQSVRGNESNRRLIVLGFPFGWNAWRSFRMASIFVCLFVCWFYAVCFCRAEHAMFGVGRFHRWSIAIGPPFRLMLAPRNRLSWLFASSWSSNKKMTIGFYWDSLADHLPRNRLRPDLLR